MGERDGETETLGHPEPRAETHRRAKILRGTLAGAGGAAGGGPWRAGLGAWALLQLLLSESS